MSDLVLYDVSDHVATITLNRPERRNAQNPQLLDLLNDCWERAAADDDVKVILLRAEGPHFSAGHDTSGVKNDELSSVDDNIAETGTLGLYRWETKRFLGYSRRWREIPKPSIAAVQGACIAGGLMLVWPCDLIVAADNARFADPVVMMGVGGVEYHGHTWELGARKAKEMLFTAKPVLADEAERRGMVNRVVPVEELDQKSRELALEIAQMHPHALEMAKRVVNQTLDIQGQYAALQSCFDIHHLGHNSSYVQTGSFIMVDHNAVKASGKV
ncbi:MAG: enoyl-CoA hydratase [Sphingomonadaceae bacterium]|nr:enoyl-CoA hydratase [Sphingomonadaceae bacterium]